MTATTEPSLEQRFKKDLLPNINWETVLNALGLEPKAKSDHFQTICPKCRQKECAFYPNEAKEDPRFYCSRQNECKYSQHILAHLNGDSFPKDEEWRNSVQKLANLAGIPFEISQPKSFKKPTSSKGLNILQDYWEYLKNRFPDSPAEDYLKGRKLNPDSSSFGYFPKELSEVLKWAKEKGYSEDELINCGIILEGENGKFPSMYGRLAGAFVDQKGNIHNLWGRDITDNAAGAKYLNLKDTEVTHKKSPYGADQFHKGSAYWVEGYLDVAAAMECGYPALASGTASIPQNMVESMRGLDAIVIALDKDGAGGAGTFKFIEKNANGDTKLYTINHELMKGCKDIAELYQKHGKDAVDEVFRPDNLESAFSFAAKYILDRNRPENGWSPVSTEKALEEAIAFDKKVTEESKLPTLTEYFWKTGIQKELDLNSDAMDAMIESMSRKKKEAQLKSQIESGLSKAIEKFKEGDLEAVASLSKKINERFISHGGTTAETPLKFIKDFGYDWLNREPPEKEMLLHCTNKGGKPKGFLPKGIVAMLAGAGGVGKSHLVTQLAISITTGQPLFGEIYPNKQGNVFLGMGENSIDDIRRILWKNSKELKQEQKEDLSENLAIRSFHGQDAAFLDENGNPSPFFYRLKEELIRTAPEKGWSLLIFDPASRIMGIDAEKDNALATRFISLLEELSEAVPGHPTVFIAHHVNKASIQSDGDPNQSAARGASALTDGCRWQANLFKQKDKDIYTLSVPKTNQTAPIDPITLQKDNNGRLCIEIENTPNKIFG